MIFIYLMHCTKSKCKSFVQAIEGVTFYFLFTNKITGFVFVKEEYQGVKISKISTMKKTTDFEFLQLLMIREGSNNYCMTSYFI